MLIITKIIVTLDFINASLTRDNTYNIAKGMGSAELARKEDPIELDSNLTL